MYNLRGYSVPRRPAPRHHYKTTQFDGYQSDGYVSSCELDDDLIVVVKVDSEYRTYYRAKFGAEASLRN